MPFTLHITGHRAHGTMYHPYTCHTPSPVIYIHHTHSLLHIHTIYHNTRMLTTCIYHSPQPLHIPYTHHMPSRHDTLHTRQVSVHMSSIHIWAVHKQHKELGNFASHVKGLLCPRHTPILLLPSLSERSHSSLVWLTAWLDHLAFFKKPSSWETLGDACP